MVQVPFNRCLVDFDSTDHFWFVCGKCGKNMGVRDAEIDPVSIRIVTICECGQTGFRKMYKKVYEFPGELKGHGII